MRKRNKILLATVLSLGLIGTVTAYMGNHKGAHMVEHFKAKLTKKLDLNTDQVSKLDLVAQNMMQVRQDFKQSRSGTMRDVMQLLDAQTLDQTRALQMVRERTQQVEQNASTMIASIATFTDSLNPEQKSQLKQMVEKRMQHRKERMEKHRHKKWHDDMESEEQS